VLTRELANCYAAAGVRRGSGCDYRKVIAGVVGDGEITCLLANNVWDHMDLRIRSCTAVAGRRGHAPVVGGGGQVGGKKQHKKHVKRTRVKHVLKRDSAKTHLISAFDGARGELFSNVTERRI
jgi:hypothetical protein